MSLNTTLFGSRVARRLFVSFALACLVTIGTSAVFTLFEIDKTLEARAGDELLRANRDLGYLILDRLAIAENMLSALSDRETQFKPIALDAAEIRTADGPQSLFGQTLDLPGIDVVDVGRTDLIVNGDRILLARRTAGGLIVASIDPGYLWQSSSLLPADTNICVVAHGVNEPLFCSAHLSPSAGRALIESLAHAPGGDVAWDDRDVGMMVAGSELSLPSRFRAAPWSIVSSRRTAMVLESMATFSAGFPRAIAISLIAIVLLAVVQIRRILRPLNQLVVATRKIAAQQFSARVNLDRDDEFGELGDAMNAMAKQLGRQFDTLTALTDIDGLILHSRQTEEVLDAVIERLSAIVRGCDISVLLIDSDQPSRARLYCKATEGDDKRDVVRCAISNELRHWLSQQAKGCLQDDVAIQSGLQPFPATDKPRPVFVMPILRGDELQGALLARFELGAVIADVELHSLREFATRVAVAISAAERDQQLMHRANFDTLTGLPNRQLCLDRLRQALAIARREDHKLAVLFIDLDGFKHINDSLGHASGDELLRETALRLTSALRESDTVGRLGGDEYVVVLPHVHGALEVDVIVGNIMDALKWPFRVGGRESFVSASIGVAIFPDDALTADDLLRKADTAMYGAKDRGRARYLYFAREMDQGIHERLALQSDLRIALSNKELFLVYQPQVDLVTGDVVCAEALLRWKHPSRGLIPPDLFVPVLEETGLVECVGSWVLRSALAEFSRWKRQGLSIPRVSVNVATRQLFDAGFIGLIDECLHSSQLEGACLEIELTESSLVTDLARADRVLRELTGRGIRTAIDDFGTGYSSLGYLKDLTFDMVKIDRAFISALPEEKSLAIVKAVLGMAHSLGKKVVAEGIESEGQRRQLLSLKCDIGQGFLLGRPLAGPAFIEWLDEAEGTLVVNEVFARDA